MTLNVCYEGSYFVSQGQADYVEKGSNSGKDKASAPLFTYVNEDKLKSIPTYNCKYETVQIQSLSDFTNLYQSLETVQYT